MPDYSFLAFGPSQVGYNSFVGFGTVTVASGGVTLTITDDDPVFEDEQNAGGQTRDASQQVLAYSFGGVPAGNVAQSVYRTAVTNITTGQTGFDYGIRLYQGTNPSSPGAQAGSYYHAFDIAVSQGDVLQYGSGSIVGNVSYTTLIGAEVAGTFSVADVSVNESDAGSTTGYFTVTRANGTSAASVGYTIQPSGASADTTAAAGVDYVAAASGTVSFAAGQTSVLVPFQVLGDTLPERNEQFRISLSSATNGGTISRGTATATIIDNDATPGSQFGTSGNDTLIANTAGAMLIGLAGDDTYLVNNSADQVVEANGGGTDIVYTTVSYNLGVNEVEALSVANQQTTTAINLIGNYASQTIVGNYGDNVLNGGSGGVDTLIGLFGNDTYAVGDSRTVVVEQAGQGFDTLVTSVSYTLAAGVSVELFTAQDRGSTTGLRLIGNEVSQTIAGTAGNDTISGGGGADVLIGGAGADRFDFTTALGTGNVATLADFAAGTDRIGLSTTAFVGLGTTLDANEFVVGSAATGTGAQIVYNQATGQLFYDSDGTGSGAAVLFAQVVPGTAITTGTFDMIAPAAMTGA